MRLKKLITCLIIGGIMLLCFVGNSFASEGGMEETRIEIGTDETILNSETDETVLEEENESDTAVVDEQEETVLDEGNGDESYVYDGEEFIESFPMRQEKGLNVLSTARSLTGTINYTYWAIHAGADLGNILEDGRELDHVGCIMLKISSGWKTAYCIHHNADLQGGHQYADIESYLTNSEKKELTGCALYYGFKFGSWNPGLDTVPSNVDKGRYTATQIMIWIIEKGWYNYDKTSYAFSLTDKALKVAKTICDKSDQEPMGDSYQYFSKIYEQMKQYGVMPSFGTRSEGAAKTYRMGYDASKKEYSLTLVDNNNILKNCTVSGLPQSASYKIDGNRLSIMSKQPINGTIKLNKEVISRETAVTVWSDQTDSTYQQVGTYAEPEKSIMPVYLKLQTILGSVSLEKRWNDNNYPERPGKVKFNLHRGLTGTNKDALIQSIELDVSTAWKITFNDLPQYDLNGNKFIYTIFEERLSNYNTTMDIENVSEYNQKVIFTNSLKTGSASLKKVSAEGNITSENDFYNLEGAVYGVYRDEKCTLTVGELRTDKSGDSNTLTDLPIGTYYVKEIQAPQGYRLDETVYRVIVEFEKTAKIQVSDVPYKCSINILKSDSNQDPMNDVTFAIFDLDGNKLNEKTTDDKGIISFDGLSAGEYQIVETATTNTVQLLKEPIQVQLPVTLTEEEFKKWNGDRKDVVYDEEKKIYKIYSVTYNIENGRNIKLPMTGGDGNKSMQFKLIIGGVLLVIGIGLISSKNRNILKK